MGGTMSLLRCAACAAILVSQTFSQIVINEVLYDPVGTDTGNECIELKNIGSSTIDLTGFDLYPDDIGYFTFPATSLTPGSLLVVHLRQSGTNSPTDVYHATPTSNLGNSSGSAALFNSTTHSSSTLVSFVQWGASNNAWSSAAVTAGLWTATTDSVPQVAEGHSIEYDGSGISRSDWFDQSSPTLGLQNALPVTWVSFGARATDGGILLEWTTAEEPDNYGFEIERRAMSSPPGDWKEVGFVVSEGVRAAGTDYRFVDTVGAPGRWAYRLRQIDRSGSSSVSRTVEVESGGIRDDGFLRTYPNPFNPNTKIGFKLQVSGFTSLKIFDLVGRMVATLIDGEMRPGSYEVTWDATGLPSGTYFCLLSAGELRETRKLVLQK